MDPTRFHSLQKHEVKDALQSVMAQKTLFQLGFFLFQVCVLTRVMRDPFLRVLQNSRLTNCQSDLGEYRHKKMIFRDIKCVSRNDIFHRNHEACENTRVLLLMINVKMPPNQEFSPIKFANRKCRLSFSLRFKHEPFSKRFLTITRFWYLPNYFRH